MNWQAILGGTTTGAIGDSGGGGGIAGPGPGVGGSGKGASGAATSFSSSYSTGTDLAAALPWLIGGGVVLALMALLLFARK